MELTEKQTLTLLDPTLNPIHHNQFIRKWLHDPNRPDHITHILVELSNIRKVDKKKYYFYQDELYVIDYTPTKYRLKEGKWQIVDTFSGQRTRSR